MDNLYILRRMTLGNAFEFQDKTSLTNLQPEPRPDLLVPRSRLRFLMPSYGDAAIVINYACVSLRAIFFTKLTFVFAFYLNNSIYFYPVV